HSVAPAQDRAGAEAEEGPAAQAPLLGGLEQEARAVAAQLQERADRSLDVVHEAVADGDHVRVLGEPARSVQVGLEPGQRRGRGAHLRLPFRIWSTSAIETPRESISTAMW